MNRRKFLELTTTGALGALFYPAASSASSTTRSLASIEQQYGGRLGVVVWNAATNQHEGHRTDERFMLCSTYKMLLVAQVLAHIDSGQEQADRRVVFDEKAI